MGSFSYSHGLEWAISQGEVKNRAALERWVMDIIIHGAGRNDAILLAQAYHTASTTELSDLVELASAFNPSKERQIETLSQGAAFAKVTRTVWPTDLPDMPYPIAVGVAAQQHELPLAAVTNLYLHAFAANLVSAAVRFMPLGQSDGQAVLAALTDTLSHVSEAAQSATIDDLGGCAFRADMASMQHETLSSRIFRT